MTSFNEAWTCHEAQQCILSINDTLREHDLLDSFIYEGQIHTILRTCSQCRSGSTNPRRCTGWKLEFRELSALRFVPVEIKEGHTVRVSVEGKFDFTRPSGGRFDRVWVPMPMRTSVSSIVVEELAGDLITRQHIDMANVGQPGPVWHLQLGGRPGLRRERPEYEWLDVPRWPAHPLDFTLTVELAVFSFWWDKWNHLKDTNPWGLWIKRSEYLVLSHYFQRMQEYLARPSSLKSWLAFQCNQISGWNPRPS